MSFFENKRQVINKYMPKISWLLFLLFVVIKESNAQQTFSFLSHPSSSIQNAFGGQVVSLQGQNTLRIFQNPALVDSASQATLATSVAPISGQGLLFSVATELLPKKENRHIGFGLRGLSHGTFVGRDAVGSATTNFGAGHFMAQGVYAQQKGAITFGISGKLAASFIENYASFAFLTDWGGTFQHPTKNISVGLVAQNFGFTRINSVLSEQFLPFNLVAGISFKPMYMPIRFTVTADRLQKRNPFTETEIYTNATAFQQVVGHLSIGGEAFLHPNLRILLGYNYRTNTEFKQRNKTSFGGVGYGLQFQKKKLGIGISRSVLFPPIGRWVVDAQWKIE